MVTQNNQQEERKVNLQNCKTSHILVQLRNMTCILQFVAILCCYTYLLENITRLYQQLQQLQQNFHEYPTTIRFGLVLVRLLVNEWNFE